MEEMGRYVNDKVLEQLTDATKGPKQYTDSTTKSLMMLPLVPSPLLRKS
jgi:hypothetical protein